MQNHMSLVKDVRGCMTRFDPLTPEIVASQSQDGLTYDELKYTLSECGMDINKVVFDDSRGFQNAFYADFEQGHYCWIPCHKAGLKAIINTMVYRPEIIAATRFIWIMLECCKKTGLITRLRYEENRTKNYCPHCGRWTKISLAETETDF